MENKKQKMVGKQKTQNTNHKKKIKLKKFTLNICFGIKTWVLLKTQFDFD